MIWLSGAANEALATVARAEGIGLMAQPDSHVERFIPQFPVWSADNGCFAQGATFDADRWLDWLEGIAEHAATCLFAVLPDVWGDGPAAVARSLPYVSAVRGMGYPVAIVAQPGIDCDSYPWDQSDCLFIGGPNDWHRSETVDQLVQEAHQRGLWAHDGRVNSERRLRCKRVAGYDSSDGTFIKYGPDINLSRVLGWVRRAREQPTLWDVPA